MKINKFIYKISSEINDLSQMIKSSFLILNNYLNKNEFKKENIINEITKNEKKINNFQLIYDDNNIQDIINKNLKEKEIRFILGTKKIILKLVEINEYLIDSFTFSSDNFSDETINLENIDINIINLINLIIGNYDEIIHIFILLSFNNEIKKRLKVLLTNCKTIKEKIQHLKNYYLNIIIEKEKLYSTLFFINLIDNINFINEIIERIIADIYFIYTGKNYEYEDLYNLIH